MTLTASVVPAKATTGLTVAVDKANLSLAANGSATLAVSITGALPAPGNYTGNVVLQASGVTVRIP